MEIVKKIDKLYAVIESKRLQKSSINSVIGIRLKDGELIVDIDEICRIFPANGEVFTGRTFDGKNESLNDGDLIEIPVIEVLFEERPKLTTIHHSSVNRRQYYRVIEIPANLLDKDCFELSRIEDFLSKSDRLNLKQGELYFSIIDKLYGPFKINGSKLEPKIGKEASIYDFDEHILTRYRDEQLLIDKPAIEIGKIDCMNTMQLLDWVKEKINAFANYGGEVNRIKDLLRKSNLGAGELENSRFKRSINVLEQMELSIDELNILKNNNELWTTIFDNAYKCHKQELRDEHLNKLQEEFSLKEEEYTKKVSTISESLIEFQRTVKEKSDKLYEINAKLRSAEKELKYLTEKQEEILIGLKLQAGISMSQLPVNSSLGSIETCEIKCFKASTDMEFESISDYLDCLKNIYKFSSQKRSLFEHSLGIIADKKFIISNHIQFLISFISSLGNGILCLQQAEADWIKFEKFFENGLRKTIDLAESKPEIRHFYVLQDFNLPCIECYGKPLLDIADNLREFIPGTNRCWPENLYVFVVPLSLKQEGFGFEMNIQTFKNWGVFPYVEDFDGNYKIEPIGSIAFEAIDDEIFDRSNADIISYLN